MKDSLSFDCLCFYGASVVSKKLGLLKRSLALLQHKCLSWRVMGSFTLHTHTLIVLRQRWSSTYRVSCYMIIFWLANRLRRLNCFWFVSLCFECHRLDEGGGVMWPTLVTYSTRTQTCSCSERSEETSLWLVWERSSFRGSKCQFWYFLLISQPCLQMWNVWPCSDSATCDCDLTVDILHQYVNRRLSV